MSPELICKRQHQQVGQGVQAVQRSTPWNGFRASACHPGDGVAEHQIASVPAGLMAQLIGAQIGRIGQVRRRAVQMNFHDCPALAIRSQ